MKKINFDQLFFNSILDLKKKTLIEDLDYSQRLMLLRLDINKKLC